MKPIIALFFILMISSHFYPLNSEKAEYAPGPGFFTFNLKCWSMILDLSFPILVIYAFTNVEL